MRKESNEINRLDGERKLERRERKGREGKVILEAHHRNSNLCYANIKHSTSKRGIVCACEGFIRIYNMFLFCSALVAELRSE